jgi:sec-independent protein translocase protein TatC
MRRKISKRALPDDPEDFKATLGEHLDELRTRIMRVLGFLVVAWAIAWYFTPRFNAYIEYLGFAQLRRDGIEARPTFTTFTDPFMLMLQLSFLLAVIVAVPLAVMQLWGFIKPGLKPNERKIVSSVGPFTVLLFATGVGFCWLVVPQSIAWIADYVRDYPPGVSIMQDPGKLTFFILKFMLAFGLAFQLPLIVYILGKIGILSPDTLLKYWRQATTAIFVIAMVITPSNDPGSMLMMAIPLTVLFIISVYVVKWTVKMPKDKITGPEDSSE